MGVDPAKLIYQIHALTASPMARLCFFSAARLGKKNEAAKVHPASIASSKNTLRNPLVAWKCTMIGIASEATPKVTRYLIANTLERYSSGV